MSSRRTAVVVLGVVLGLAAFTATYLTVFTFGDPFSGTWRLNPDDPYAVVIRLQRAGYSLAVDNGQNGSGWVRARRSGNVLTATLGSLADGAPKGAVSTVVFHLWDGHLVETDHGLNLLLKRTSGSTSMPPRQSPAIGGILNGSSAGPLATQPTADSWRGTQRTDGVTARQAVCERKKVLQVLVAAAGLEPATRGL